MPCVWATFVLLDSFHRADFAKNMPASANGWSSQQHSTVDLDDEHSTLSRDREYSVTSMDSARSLPVGTSSGRFGNGPMIGPGSPLHRVTTDDINPNAYNVTYRRPPKLSADDSALPSDAPGSKRSSSGTKGKGDAGKGEPCSVQRIKLSILSHPYPRYRSYLC